MSNAICLPQKGRAWRRSLVRNLFFVGLALVVVRPCAAQERPYPAGPIRFIVGAPPGGPIDIAARLLSQYLPAILGQPSFVENKAGAGGILATRAVALAVPDGLTVLSAANSMLATEKSNSQAGYHVERDLIPILSIGWTPNIIVAAPTLPVSSLKELIELSRTRDLNYGTLGRGTTTHLMTEYLLQNAAHTKIQHISYPGSAAALTAVAGNQLDVACVAMIAAVSLVQTNKIKAIVVTSSRRVESLADVPTLTEAGFPGYDYVTWVGVFMPAKTPSAIVEIFKSAALKTLAMKEVREKLLALGFEPEAVFGDQFRKQVSTELAHWGEVVAKTGIKAE
jgi:tripartite-type tricarboxylate transporter receptor subunit TctC